MSEPLPFDTTQVTSKANRSHPKAGDPCHPLAEGAHAPAIAISVGLGSDPLYDKNVAQPVTNRNGDPGVVAFSSKDHGADAGEVAPTLRKMGHDASHANGGGQVAVAFRACGQDGFTPGEVSPPIAESDGGGSGVPTALYGDYRDRLPGEKDDDYWQRMTDYEREHGIDPTATQVQWASGGGKIENQTAQALRTGAEHNYQFARTGMTVRRLTPVECERLQGFPDGHTEWGIDEKGNRVNLSDSARYRQMGNAVTVNVAEFLGRIIAKVLT